MSDDMPRRVREGETFSAGLGRRKDAPQG